MKLTLKELKAYIAMGAKTMQDIRAMAMSLPYQNKKISSTQSSTL